MRISDWSSDVCSSDLPALQQLRHELCFVGCLEAVPPQGFGQCFFEPIAGGGLLDKLQYLFIAFMGVRQYLCWHFLRLGLKPAYWLAWRRSKTWYCAYLHAGAACS